MRASSFFLVGVHKSGTTSLCTWLGAHPETQASNRKEPYFFMDLDHPLANRHGLSVHADGFAAYENFFDEPANGRLRFEATPHLFYQETARQYLTHCEHAPLIVMLLREPASRLLSSFRFRRDNQGHCDRSLTFDRYVDCLLAGRPDKLDWYFRHEAALWVAKRELELSKYVQWLDWWQEQTSPNQLEVHLFEHLCHEPEVVVTALCERLGIESSFYQQYDWQPQNKSYGIGWQGIHRALLRIHPLLPRGAVYEHAKGLYRGWQASSAGQEHDFEEGLERVRAYFQYWNRELEERYSLDLARWWGKEALGGSATTSDGDEL